MNIEIKNNYLKIFFLALLSGVSSVLLLIFYFKLWKLNLKYPIIAPVGDLLIYVALFQNIIDNGWISDSTRFGLLSKEGFFSFDYFPFFSDFINFAIAKLFIFFTKNPYLIINLFFIFSFFLISFFSFICLKVYGISTLISFFLAIYYAFLSYHFQRSIYHVFLSNYSCFPLIMIVVYWFYYGKISLIIKNQKQKYCLDLNWCFIFSLLIIAYCCGTGFYYNAYSSIMLLLVWFLKSLEDEKFFSKNLTIFFVFAIFTFVFFLYLYIPYFVFIFKYKYIALVRNLNENFFYSLKLVSLFIPSSNHFIDQFAKLGIYWKDKTDIWENSSCYLGILLGSVFIFSILWLIAKANGNKILEKTIKRFALNDEDVNKISFISSLNFLSFLFVISGGLIAINFGSVFFRSNARFVVVIALLCLIIFGIIIDGILKKNNLRNSILFKISLVLIYIFSFLDMVGKPIISNNDVTSYHEIFLNNNRKNEYLIEDSENFKFAEYNAKITDMVDSNINFVKKIESVMSDNSAIFVMPYRYWPERMNDSYTSLIFYIHSKKLRWSYPLIENKDNIKIEKKIFNSSSYDNFIAEIKKLGFEGLVLNLFDYQNCLNNEPCVKSNFTIKNLKEKMIKMGGNSLIKSDNGYFIFIKI